MKTRSKVKSKSSKVSRDKFTGRQRRVAKLERKIEALTSVYNALCRMEETL